MKLQSVKEIIKYNFVDNEQHVCFYEAFNANERFTEGGNISFEKKILLPPIVFKIRADTNLCCKKKVKQIDPKMSSVYVPKMLV